VNAYYGALLWASTTLSQDYVNYAKLLLATEQQAAQVYWHLYPQQSTTARDNPYPEAEVRALVTMGNVEDWQSGAWLFWGAERSEIAAIQMLPVTPVNEVRGSSDARAEWEPDIVHRSSMTPSGSRMCGRTRQANLPIRLSAMNGVPSSLYPSVPLMRSHCTRPGNA
jgi:endoglucanase Acf2